MKSVDPIRDEKKIQTMKTYLKGKNSRDYTLFVVRINGALRISDLLTLKWRDVLENPKKFKEISLLEGKIKKERRIQLNQTSQRALEELLGSLEIFSMDGLPLSIAWRRSESHLSPTSFKHFKRSSKSRWN